ncbi:hypothetical protein [Actinomadura sediminis]|uniref:Uncharacterized protein n=1 Tax=Actinomadura sediminis TaxID=1038904 RepID=A0ABW3ENC9_9ACTN
MRRPLQAWFGLSGRLGRSGRLGLSGRLGGSGRSEVVLLTADRRLRAVAEEVETWRVLADMEAARSRVRLREGRVWDAGMCAGRAAAFRAAADQVEDALTGSGESREPVRRGR